MSENILDNIIKPSICYVDITPKDVTVGFWEPHIYLH